jgi:actin-related protein
MNKEPFQYSQDNENDIERILKDVIFEQLRNSPDDHPFFYVDSFELTKSKREIISEILFETYNVPTLIYGFSPILSGFYSYIKRDIDSLEITGFIVEISKTSIKVSPLVWT